MPISRLVPFLLVLLALGSPARGDALPAAPLPPAQIDSLVSTLQDGPARDRLIAQLQAMAAAQRSQQPIASPVPVTLLTRAGAALDQIGTDMVQTASLVVNAPAIWRWASNQIGSPQAHDHWLEIGQHVIMVFGAATLADVLTRALLAPLRRRLRGRRSGARFRLLIGRVTLDALPVLAYAAAGYGVMAVITTRFATHQIALELIDAVVLARLLLVVAHGLLVGPRDLAWPRLTLSEESTSYLYVWARRFIGWAVYGFGFVASTWWIGIPGALYITLQKSVALVLAGLAIVFILQNRKSVGDWLRPKPVAPPDDSDPTLAPAMPPPKRYPAFDLLRRRLADTWHVLAVGYVLAIFAVYALHIDGGFEFVLRGTMLTLLVVGAARLLTRTVARLAARGFAIPPDLGHHLPTLELRANRYLPVLTGLASLVIWCFAILSLFEVWGLGAYAWLGTELGRRTASSATTIAAILGGGFVVWELLNAAIDRRLAVLEAATATPGQRTRMRTLLPLLRNALWIVLMGIVALLVLSQLGLNIAPLLAGAGVVGLAVGFGSQALVKDIITGLFMLIEDTVALGDVVDLGNQHSGVVEAISLRTITLRDTAGTVHTLPFSEIATVKNMTKGYAFWVIDLAMPISTDTDRVLEIYRAVGAELRQDATLGPSILADLEAFGVTSFGSGTVQVQARIKTLPLRQWAVGREFNRRVKRAFEAAGMAQPSGSQTLILGSETNSLLERFLPSQNPASASSTST